MYRHKISLLNEANNENSCYVFARPRVLQLIMKDKQDWSRPQHEPLDYMYVSSTSSTFVLFHK